MDTFRRDLLSWSSRIRRAGYLKSLEVKVLEHGEFTLTGGWDGGEYSKKYTRQYVLGRFITAPSLQQRPQYRVCRFRDEFVRGALAARGV